MIMAENIMEKGACLGQIEKFRMIFPDGAEITYANIVIAIKNSLDVDWFVREFHPAIYKAYMDGITPLKEISCRERDSLRNTYNLKVMPIWKTHKAKVLDNLKTCGLDIALEKNNILRQEYFLEKAPWQHIFDTGEALLTETYSHGVAKILMNLLAENNN